MISIFNVLVDLFCTGLLFDAELSQHIRLLHWILSPLGHPILTNLYTTKFTIFDWIFLLLLSNSSQTFLLDFFVSIHFFFCLGNWSDFYERLMRFNISSSLNFRWVTGKFEFSNVELSFLSFILSWTIKSLFSCFRRFEFHTSKLKWWIYSTILIKVNNNKHIGSNGSFPFPKFKKIDNDHGNNCNSDDIESNESNRISTKWWTWNRMDGVSETAESENLLKIDLAINYPVI